MKRLSHVLTQGLLVAVAWFTAAQVRAQVELDNHAFRLVLGQSGLTPLRGVEELEENPKQSILIVFGRTDVLERIPGGLGAFVNAGGAVLVATDRPAPAGNRLHTEFRVRVFNQVLRVKRGDPCYGDSVECPFIRPGSGSDASIFETSLPIATNRPSHLLNQGKLPVLASLPSNLPFAVGGTLGEGQGRFLVMADHSIFINGMMLPRDLENGNMQFAYNCVRWLREDRKRDRVLFVDEGKIETNFDIPLQTLPDIPLSPVQMANVVIAAAEKEDLFNRVILDMAGHRQVMRVALISLTAAMLVYGVYRLMRAGYQLEPKVPLVSHSMVQLALAVAVVDQRNQHVLAGGNFLEAGRDLARDSLAALGYDPSGTPTADSLRLRVKGSWWHRQAMASRVRRLWQVGYGASRRGLSRKQFARLTADAEEVRTAAQRGMVKIDVHQ